METEGEENVGKDIVEVSFPHEPPEKNVEKYFESKLQNERFFNYPNWDVARTGPDMMLVHAHRDLRLAEENLAAKRAEFITTRKVLDAEWQDLESKQKYLRENFVIFHKFVEENAEKKERANRRIEQELIKHDARDAEIALVRAKIEKMMVVRDSLEEKLAGLKIFEDYLTQVITETTEFTSIVHVLSRFDALENSRYDLMRQQGEHMDDLTYRRSQMVKLVEEHIQIFMGLNNKLAELEARYEKTKSEAVHWECVLYNVQNKSCKELLHYIQVRDAIVNLYIQMCNRKKTPVNIPSHKLEEQLLFIKVTIMEYKRIIKLAERRTASHAAGSTAKSVDPNYLTTTKHCF